MKSIMQPLKRSEYKEVYERMYFLCIHSSYFWQQSFGGPTPSLILSIWFGRASSISPSVLCDLDLSQSIIYPGHSNCLEIQALTQTGNEMQEVFCNFQETYIWTFLLDLNPFSWALYVRSSQQNSNSNKTLLLCRF